LSLMLGFGVVSRLASGWVCDRIGGRRTLLLGSSLQALALLLFLPFDGLVGLYIVSALFGLFQGGLLPSYGVRVREFFPPQGAVESNASARRPARRAHRARRRSRGPGVRRRPLHDRFPPAGADRPPPRSPRAPPPRLEGAALDRPASSCRGDCRARHDHAHP